MKHAFMLTVLILSLPRIGISEEAPKYTIGVINPLSGFFQEGGQACRLGQEVAIDELSEETKKRLSFHYEDDQGSGKLAVTAIKKLISNKNLLAVSVFGSQSAIPVNPISESQTLPVVALSAHPDLMKNKYAFSTWRTAEYEAGLFAKNVIKKGDQKVALLSLESEYPQSIRSYFLKALGSSAEVVIDESFSEVSGLSSVVTKIARSGVDVVFLNVLGTSFSYLARKLHEQGYQRETMALHANTIPSIFKAAGKEATEGMVFFSPVADPAFLSKISKEDQREYSMSYAYLCYLGLKFMTEAFEPLSERSVISRADVFSKMSNLRELSVFQTKIPIVDKRIMLPMVRVLARDGLVQRENK